MSFSLSTSVIIARRRLISFSWPIVQLFHFRKQLLFINKSFASKKVHFILRQTSSYFSSSISCHKLTMRDRPTSPHKFTSHRFAGWLDTGTSRAVGTHAINHPSPEAPSLLRGPHPLGTGLTVWLGWRRTERNVQTKLFKSFYPNMARETKTKRPPLCENNRSKKYPAHTI